MARIVAVGCLFSPEPVRLTSEGRPGRLESYSEGQTCQRKLPKRHLLTNRHNYSFSFTNSGARRASARPATGSPKTISLTAWRNPCGLRRREPITAHG